MGQNAMEYPQAQELGQNAVQVTIPSAILMSGINRSIFATADDELRPVMNGIYFDITTEDLTLVASDGHKLVRCKLCHTGQREGGFHPAEKTGQPAQEPASEGTGRRADRFRRP